MPLVYTLDASLVTVSGGGSLSGITQGDGSHLVGQTITLNSRAWNVVDTNDNDAFFEDNDTSQTLNGAQVINGVTLASGLVVEAEYRITVSDPDGNTYTVIGFNVREPGAPNAFGTIEALAFIGPVGGFPPDNVPLTVLGAFEGPQTGNNPTTYASYATPPCFCPGTLIDTASGPRPVENLRRGDLVLTEDAGPQPVRWIGRVGFSAAQIRAEPGLAPIRIGAGALGAGLPARDLMVSPQHRILLGGWRAELYFGAGELLVAAKHLVNGRSIRAVQPRGGVEYLHLLLDRHHILRSEGLPSESYLPGDQTAPHFDRGAQAELRRLFAAPTARPALRAWESGLLAG